MWALSPVMLGGQDGERERRIFEERPSPVFLAVSGVGNIHQGQRGEDF